MVGDTWVSSTACCASTFSCSEDTPGSSAGNRSSSNCSIRRGAAARNAISASLTPG